MTKLVIHTFLNGIHFSYNEFAKHNLAAVATKYYKKAFVRVAGKQVIVWWIDILSFVETISAS